MLALLIGGTHWLVGGYPVRTPLGAAFRSLLRVTLAYLAIGTAIVPAVLALAYCARSLVRPERPVDAAAAALGAGAFVAFAYVAATQGAEERYIAPLAPVLILLAMVALARRAVGPLLVLVAGVVVARAISVTGVGVDIGPYGYFSQAAQSVLPPRGARQGLPHRTGARRARADDRARDRGGGGGAGGGCRRAGARISPSARRRRSSRGFGLVAGVYSMNQFMKLAGYPALSFEQQAWIDRAVGTGADVQLAPLGLEGVQGELVSFNRSLSRPVLRPTLTVDPVTGALHGAPRYLATQDGVLQAIGIGGPQVAESTYLPVQARLIRVAPRALWQLTSPRSVRIFGTGRLRDRHARAAAGDHREAALHVRHRAQRPVGHAARGDHAGGARSCGSAAAAPRRSSASAAGPVPEPRRELARRRRRARCSAGAAADRSAA